MRRLPGILLLTGATLVVIVALLVSGLRLALPHLDSWRPQILAKIESATGLPVDVSHIEASWQNFGPTLRCAGYQRQPERWRPPQNQTRHPGAGCLAKPAASALAVSRSHLLATSADD